MYYGQSFFHWCHSLGLEDISLFFLDLLPYSDVDACKGYFYGAIFLVIVAVLLCCRDLRTCINFHINFFFAAPNCVALTAACSHTRFRCSNGLSAYQLICPTIFLLVLASLSLFPNAQWYIGKLTLTLRKCRWRWVLERSRRISVTFFSHFLKEKSF